MSSRVLCISVVVFLLFLAACQQSPTAGVVINQEPTGPRDITVNSTPAPQPAQIPAAPAPQPAQAPAPMHIPINVLPQQAPEVYIVPAEKPVVDPVQSCLDGCQLQCKQNAAAACRQPTGTACKANCGTMIDPESCKSACALRDARSCEPKFKEWCGAKCKEHCY